MDRLANLFAAHRAWFVVAVLLASGLAIAGIPRLEYDEEPRSIFQTAGQDFAQLERFYDDFGADDNDILVLVQGEDLFSPTGVAALRSFVTEAARLEGVQSVASLLDIRRYGRMVLPLMPPGDAPPERFATARLQSLAHPVVVGHFLSPDAHVTELAVRLEGGSLPISVVEPVVKRLRKLADDRLESQGLKAWLAGHPGIRVETLTLLRSELYKSTLLSALVSVVIALVVFRRVAPLIISLVAPGMCVLWTMGAMGWCGEKINGVNNVLPALMFTLGFADTMQLLVHIRYRRSQGAAPRESATDGIRYMGLACTLAALTTVVGFGSLALARTQGIQRFGLACGGGVMLEYLVVISVVPLLASTRLGLGVLPPRTSGSAAAGARWLEAIINLVYRHPRTVALTLTTATVAMAIPALRLGADLRWTETIPTQSETAQAFVRSDEAFGGMLRLAVVVEWPERLTLRSDELLSAVGDIHAILESQPLLRYPFSIRTLLEGIAGRGGDLASQVDSLRRTPKHLLTRVLREDRRRLVVTARLPDAGAAAIIPAVAELTRQLDAWQTRHAGFQAHVTGTVVVAADSLHMMIEDLRSSLSSAAAVIFLVMTVGFRNLRLGLISILPNLLPLACVGYGLVLTGRPLQITSVMTFNISLGIAVNNSIYALLRYQNELLLDGDPAAALRRAMRVVGSAIVGTTFVLAAGFGVLMISSMPGIQLFGGLTAVAMITAMIGVLFLLPALVLTTQRRRAFKA